MNKWRIQTNEKFEFTSDQTFIRSTVDELNLIADKYGDMKRIKK